MIVKYKYTRTISSYIYYIMDAGEVAPAISVLARKKNTSKKNETDKITEKMEGGIIVRRLEGKKISPK